MNGTTATRSSNPHYTLSGNADTVPSRCVTLPQRRVFRSRCSTPRILRLLEQTLVNATLPP